MTGEGWQVHVLSFEGPDAYARAGGIASRVAGLTAALSQSGCDTHLWFVGDPALPGEERVDGVTLHRWGQWISRYHPGGVYEAEEDKRRDLVSSLPPYLVERFILPHLADPAHRVAIMAEEWQTVHAVLHLDWLLARAGARDRVAMLWNANNTFGFDRIDWRRLAQAATITRVSRYMRHRMWNLGVDPLVIANGISPDVLRRPTAGEVRKLKRLARHRPMIAKVARWDPDKRWLLAVETVAELKRRGREPLFVARGGMEEHGAEVTALARAMGLRILVRGLEAPGAAGLGDAVQAARDADLLLLTSPLDREASQLLFAASTAVLANSGHEPFGLVGLEAMAAGGLVCVGGTGEDYVLPGWNALVLQTMNPQEFIGELDRLRAHPELERALRRRAASTAARFAWTEIVRRSVLPALAARVPPRPDAPRFEPPARRAPSDAGRPRTAYRPVTRIVNDPVPGGVAAAPARG